MLYIELLGTIIVLSSVGDMRGPVGVGGGGHVASRGGCAWVKLLCSCVCCVSRCPVCGHVPAGCVLLYHVGVRSLCFPQSVGARMGGGPIQAVIWHVYCE